MIEITETNAVNKVYLTQLTKGDVFKWGGHYYIFCSNYMSGNNGMYSGTNAFNLSTNSLVMLTKSGFGTPLAVEVFHGELKLTRV